MNLTITFTENKSSVSSLNVIKANVSIVNRHLYTRSAHYIYLLETEYYVCHLFLPE